MKATSSTFVSANRNCRARALFLLGCWLWLLCLAAPPTVRGAGVTVITHGWQFAGAVDWPIPWVDTMAVQIYSRARAHGLAPSIWEYDPSTQTFLNKGGQLPDSASGNGEMILKFNWTAESSDPGGGFAEAAGEALFTALMREWKDQKGAQHSFVELPLHFIGHSRGCVVNSEAIERLGALGINVDHVTTLDPHPAKGVYQDTQVGMHQVGVQAWTNVFFADNYWRQDLDPLDFNGEPVRGSLDHQLDETILSGAPGLNDPGYALEHSDVHLWYHGTVDQSANAGDGEVAVPPEFYNNPNPPRDKSGFYFSRIAGGARPQGGLKDGLNFRAPIRTPQTWIANGDFAYSNGPTMADVAGFGGHGGAVDAQFVSFSGSQVAWLHETPDAQNPGATVSFTLLRHNAVYVPIMSGAATLEYSVLYNPGVADHPSLEIRFANQLVNSIPFDLSSPLHVEAIDLSAFEGKTGTLEFKLTPDTLQDTEVLLGNFKITGTPKQWPNLQLQPLAQTSYQIGDIITVTWDTRNGLSTPGALVDLIFDTDANPYNGGQTIAVAGVDSSSGIGAAIVPNLPSGNYQLYARIRGNGFTRYDFLGGSITINAANPLLPVIAAQPQSQSVAAGTDVSFSVVATSATPITYQWFHDGAALTGPSASTPTLLLKNVQTGDAGGYSVLVQNAQGATSSRTASLNIIGPVNLTWTGAVSSDWFDPGNWNPKRVPTSSDNVAIKSGNVVLLSNPSFANLLRLG